MLQLNNINPQYIIDNKGKKKFVILSFSEFNQLMEDLDDLSVIAQRKNEPVISHQKVIENLKQDGLI